MIQETIQNKAVGYSLAIQRPGTSRKVSSDLIEVREDPTVEKSRLKMTKKILICPAFDAVCSADNAIRMYINRLALPSFLRKGVYALPIGLMERVDEAVQNYVKNREELVEAFLAVYPAQIEQAEEDLGRLFDPDDYASADDLRRSFRVSVRYIDFGLPRGMDSISKTIFDREREKTEDAWKDALAEMRQVLRTALADLVDHMVERLSGKTAKGKPKVFRDTLVTNLGEFLDTFAPRNIADDQELSSLVEKCKAVLSGKTPGDLRKNANVRATVAASMNEVKTKLDTMVKDRPVRKMRFDEE